MFEFYPPGTPVTLKGGRLDAGILAVKLLPGCVLYRVFWWERKRRREQWVDEGEVMGFDGVAKVRAHTPEISS